MGCGSSKTAEVPKPKNGKYFYPECSFTYEADFPISSLAPYDSTHVLFGTKGEITLLDIKSKSSKTFKEHKGRVNCLKRLSNGNYISAGQDKEIKLWDLSKESSLETLTGHTSMIWCLQELNDGRLASGADDKKLIIWDLKEKKQDCILDEEKSEISALLQLKDGKLLSGYGSGKFKVWDLSNKKVIEEFECGFGVWYFLELSDGKIAIGIGNGEIQIWNINEGKCEKKLTGGHNQPINALIEIESGVIVSASDEKDMIMWNLDDVDSKYFLKGHSGPITGLVKIGERKFASSSKDMSIKIWQ